MQCCQLYNAALEQRISAWKSQRKHVSKYDQQRQLTELRDSEPAWWNMSVWAQRSALYRLDRAFQAFFRRCRSGQTPGYPRFRSVGRYDSFSIGRAVAIKSGRLHIPKLGHVKINLYRPLGGPILDVTIRRDGGGAWWASINCEIGQATEKVAVTSVAGIDLGLTSFATLSTGEQIANPRYLRRNEDTLAARQQSLERKCNGSKSREKTRRLVARAHQKISNQRLDHARKTAKTLYNRFDLIAYEDLNIKGMRRNRKLAKSISDVAWALFIRCLASKAEEAGKWLVPVNPRGTSQICSGCGAIVKKKLGERRHRCACGLDLDRDHNAALNVLRLGQSRVDHRIAEAPCGQDRNPSC